MSIFVTRAKKAIFEKPLLSIITITRNDMFALARTINSLKPLKDFSIELVIIDGSDDQSDQKDISVLLSEFPSSRMIKGRDKGIYDAMNKGLALALGDYVWFLNGGDSNLLKNINFLHNISTDPLPVILGNYRFGMSQFSVHRNAKRKSYIRHGLPTSHQAIFYPRSFFQQIGFFLEYQVCADYASIAYLYKQNLSFIHIKEEFAEFQLDGVSGKRVDDLRIEAKMVQERILELNAVYVGLSSARHRIAAQARHVLQFLGELRT